MQGEIGYLIGRSLNQYEISEYLGRGGASRVFRAYDHEHKREVALKVLKLRIAHEESFSRRFQREIQVLMQLDHPHIVPVYDYGEDKGFTYLVMPYYAGGSLSDRILKGQNTVEDMLRIVAQITAALDFAHQHGVIHRDVKADNILFDHEGNALLSDFGLARMADTTVSITGSNIIGTPAYISPEQARGQDVSPQTDQYSFGIVLFQMLTKQLPFDAETPLGVLVKQVQEPIPIPSKINPRIPDIIDRVILKATAKNPADRFASISDLNETLEAGFDYARNPKKYKPPTIDLSVSMQATRAFVMPFVRVKSTRRWLWVVGLLILITLVTIIAIPGISGNLMRSFQDLLQPVPAVGSVPDVLNTENPSELTAPAVIPSVPIEPTQTVDHPICTLLSIGQFLITEDVIQWSIRNESDQTVVLSKLQLSWPSENGDLRTIQIDEITWNVDLSPPAAIIPEWEGEEVLRSLRGGDRGILSFAFSAKPQIGEYSLKVTFEDICTKEVSD